MHHEQIDVTGGVDTHADEHVGAVVDAVGRILATAAFPATSVGYRQLLAWLRRHGRLVRVGIEGTGSYGAGLTRFLAGQRVEVVEEGVRTGKSAVGGESPTPSMPKLPRALR